MKRLLVLLVKDDVPSRVLANRIIRQNLNLVGIVVEQKDFSAKKVAHKSNPIKIILRKVVPKILYNKLSDLKQNMKKPAQLRRISKIENKLREQASEFLSEHLGQAANNAWPSHVRVSAVSTVNSETCYDFLIRLKPDLLVVYGTNILEERIIEIPKLGALNAHHAILPDYKGNFVEFWQAYNRDYSKSGITIHFVDVGVDAGDIVFQSALRKKTTNPYMLRTLNTIEVLNNYPRVIGSVLSGKAKRRKQGASSLPTFRLSDITMERKLELYTRKN